MAQTITCPNGHPIAAAAAACPVCQTGYDGPPPPRAPLPADQDLSKWFAAAPIGLVGPPADQPILSPTTPAEITMAAAGKDWPVVPGYEILGELGRGGMGVVYRARHVGLKRIVALKMILSGAHAGPQQLARFRTEAEAIARLQHPNIVQVHDVGENDGNPFFSLEFCTGGSLDKKLTGTPIVPNEAARLVTMLAHAIQAAHEKNVIHRDLKPANILLTEEGTPKITDFGLAKKIDEAGETVSGAIMGTPSYMAPEQARGQTKEIGPAADVYALGAILYECLTGRPPFTGATKMGTLRQVLDDQPVPPTQLQPSTPKDLETICLKCLHKEPGKRYATAAALADDLGRFAAGRPVVARPVGRAERFWRWMRRNPTVAGLLAALALIVALGVASVMWFAFEAHRRAIDAENSADEAGKAKILADENKNAADASADRARWRVYVSDLQRIGQEWEEGHVDRVRRLLDGQTPDRVGGKELRGPEWHLWDHLCRSETLTFRSHTSPVMNVAFSPDGRRVASVATDYGFQPGGKGMKVWETGTGRILYELPGVNHLAWSPDGRWLAAPAEAGHNLIEIVIWDAANGQEVRRLNIFHGYAKQMYAMAFSPDSKLLALRGPVYSFRLWDVASGKEIRLIDGHFGRVSGIAFRPDGAEIVTVSGDGMLRVWNVATGLCLRTIDVSPNQELWAVACSPNGRWIAVAGNDHTLKLLEAATGKEIYSLKARGYTIRGVAFSPDSHMLAFGGSDYIVRVLETDTRNLMWSFRGHTEPIRAVAFSSDGRWLASCGDDGTVKLWPGSAGPAAITFKSRETSPLLEGGWLLRGRRAHAYRPDGRRIAMGLKDGMVGVYDADSGAEVLLLAADPGKEFPFAVAYSQDGGTLATAAFRDKSVRLWDADTGRALGGGLLHPQLVWNVVYSPDGKQLASVCLPENPDDPKAAKPMVKVWGVADGRERYSIDIAVGALPLLFSPDGSLLVVGEFRAWQATGIFRVLPEARVRIFDAKDGREIRSWAAHSDNIASLAFSPNGRQLATASADRSVKVWDVASAAELLNLQGHTAAVLEVGFNSDGTRLASSSWNTSREQYETYLWDLGSGQPVFVFDEMFVRFSPDGKRLLTIGGNAASAWDLTPFEEEHLVKRDATRLFQYHLERLWLKEDVVAAIAADSSSAMPVRRRALALGESYQELPERLSLESWLKVRVPGAGADVYRRALGLAEAAVRKEPKNADYLTTLGAAFYRSGRPAEAVEALKQSLNNRPDTPMALAFMAMAQKKHGKADGEATLKKLQELLRLNPAMGDRWARRLLLEAREVVLGARTFALRPETWAVVGPFDNPQKEKGLGPAYPPEKAVDLGATYPGKTDTVAWQLVHPNASGYVDLLPAIADSINVVSYAYCDVESAADQEVDIYLGSDDGARLWVNGTAIFAHEAPRVAVRDADQVRVKLRKGRNAFLLKIANLGALYGFFFRIESPHELKAVR